MEPSWQHPSLAEIFLVSDNYLDLELIVKEYAGIGCRARK
jgi:hypothetical protein